MTDWQQGAQDLARRWRGAPFHPAAEAWLERETPTECGIACSGGADSLTLLLMLWARRPRERARLRVLHFDHGLRGKDSRADAAFVAQIAEALGLPFHPGHPETSLTGANEAQLRAARHRFYRESGVAAILLGHQRDDVTETLLMRLCRGAGTEGLAAPRPVSRPGPDQPVHLRPLLDWPRAEIEAALRAVGLPWREDASNAQGDYFRNRVRTEVVPALEQASPSEAGAGFARSRRLLEEDADALDAWLDSILPSPPGETLPPRPLNGLPVALWRRALRRWLAAANAGDCLCASAFDELLEDWRAGRGVKVSAGPRRWIESTFDGTLFWATRPGFPDLSPVGAIPGTQLAWPGGNLLTISEIGIDGALRERILRGEFPPDECVHLSGPAQPLLIRGWQAGDRYRPLGAPGTRKLQDVFTDRKIPARERNRLPVVCGGPDEILWVPGLPPAESRRLGPEAKWALRLTWTRI